MAIAVPNTSPAQDYGVQVEDEVIGWVKGGSQSAFITTLLSTFAKREHATTDLYPGSVCDLGITSETEIQ